MNIDGIECPVGYECPEGNRIALKCEAGYYCDKPGMARGNKCRPGFFCPEGTKELTDENICIFTKATNLIDKSPKPKGCFPKKFRFLRKFSAKKAARKLKFD